VDGTERLEPSGLAESTVTAAATAAANDADDDADDGRGWVLMGDIDRMINAFLDGKFDFETLDYQLDPSSPYYDEWLAKEKIRKEEEERAAKERPTGLDYFMQAKWSPARGTYLDGDVLPLSGAAARGGQDDDYISERVRPPDPPGMVPDPYGFDKVADFISKLDWKVKDRGRLAREAAGRGAAEDQERAGYYDPTAESGQAQQASQQSMDLGGPPQPGENERAALMWEQFQKMNPGLDYTKVAQQAGGNVPGGNFSAMESNIKEMTPGASDAEFNKSIEELIKKQRMDSLLDPRSRSYDPAAAEVITKHEEEMERNKAFILNAQAQMMMAQTEARNSLLGGQEKPETPSFKPDPDRIADAIDRAFVEIENSAEMNPIEKKKLIDQLNRARLFLASGRNDAALQIIGNLTGNPDFSGPPPGVMDLGEGAVAPAGGRFIQNGDTIEYQRY